MRDQKRVGPQGADELAEVEVAAAVDPQEGHLVAAPLKILADFEHGRMFDRRGDDMAAVGIGLGRAEDRRVVALRGAGRKEDLLRLADAEVPGDLLRGRGPSPRPCAGPARTSNWG